MKATRKRTIRFTVEMDEDEARMICRYVASTPALLPTALKELAKVLGEVYFQHTGEPLE